jgi:signal transduction histidine kinase
LPVPFEQLQSELHKTGQWQGEAICRHQNDVPLHLLVQSILCHDKDNNAVGVVVLLKDVTDLRRAESAIREADRRKDEFLSVLAHELRNPLAPIRTGLDLIGMTKDDPQQIDATCEMMKRQMEQLVSLIDDLLDISRITRGKLELKVRRVELAEVVRTAVEAAMPLMEASDHQFTANLPPFPFSWTPIRTDWRKSFPICLTTRRSTRPAGDGFP